MKSSNLNNKARGLISKASRDDSIRPRAGSEAVVVSYQTKTNLDFSLFV